MYICDPFGHLRNSECKNQTMWRRKLIKVIWKRNLIRFCLLLPFVCVITSMFLFPEVAKQRHMIGSRDILVRPIKFRKSLEDLDIFLPSGRDLEKKLTFDLSNNLTFTKDNMSLVGGHFKPDSANIDGRIVLIVPYRDREVNFRRFIRHIHPFLQQQLIQYSIYVVEMEADGLFRKTVLMNAGFLEVTKREDVRCVIFHDVDMVPVNKDNLYYCDHTVRHLAVAITQFRYEKPYDWYIGGVIAFPVAHFLHVNGYSNLYIGWGGEDDDMYYRLQACGIAITEPSPDIGRYESWPHERQDLLMNMKEYTNRAAERMNLDGLNNVKYDLVEIVEKELYTWIRIQTNPSDIYSDRFVELQPVFLKWN